jgi:uncharacterized protein
MNGVARLLSDKEAAFFSEAAEGRVSDLLDLLSGGVSVDVCDDRDVPWGRTALMVAAMAGHLEAVRALLKAGASVAVKDENFPESEGGRQPLHYAAASRNIQVGEGLLAAGADINAITTFGATPLIKAVTSNNPAVINVLIERGAKLNLKPRRKRFAPPLFHAVSAGIPPADMLNLVEILLKAGSDPNLTDYQGQAPLAWLAYRQDMPEEFRLPVLTALIKAGAEVNHADSSGQTAIARGLYSVNLQVVELLAHSGANLGTIYPEQGGTLLDIAEKRMAIQEQNAARDATEAGRERAVASAARWKQMISILTAAGAKKG